MAPQTHVHTVGLYRLTCRNDATLGLEELDSIVLEPGQKRWLYGWQYRIEHGWTYLMSTCHPDASHNHLFRHDITLLENPDTRPADEGPGRWLS